METDQQALEDLILEKVTEKIFSQIFSGDESEPLGIFYEPLKPDRETNEAKNRRNYFEKFNNRKRK